MKRSNVEFYGILAAAAMSLIVAGCGQDKKLGIFAPNDSPIRVAGGSITTHATGGWKKSGKTFTSNDSKSYSEVSIGGFCAATAPAPACPADFSNLPYWEIDITDSGGNGDGITLCSNPGCDQTTGPQTVLLKTAKGKNNSDFYNKEVNPPGSTAGPGERFYNSTCHSKSHQDDDADICERISTIAVTIPANGTYAAGTYRYSCPEGECFILVNNAN
jgi:hypothetical protein